MNSVPFRVTVFFNVRESLFASVTQILPFTVVPSSIPEPLTEIFPFKFSLIVPPLTVPFCSSVNELSKLKVPALLFTIPAIRTSPLPVAVTIPVFVQPLFSAKVPPSLAVRVPVF